jgi:hypothetical protein
LRPRKLVDGLGTDVLTAFGWHAYLDQGARQNALERCLVGLSTGHILGVLQWLKVAKQTEQFRPVVEKDYRWFLESYCADGFPQKLRREHLREQLEFELERISMENSAVRRLLGDGHADALLIFVM